MEKQTLIPILAIALGVILVGCSVGAAGGIGAAIYPDDGLDPAYNVLCDGTLSAENALLLDGDPLLEVNQCLRLDRCRSPLGILDWFGGSQRGKVSLIGSDGRVIGTSGTVGSASFPINSPTYDWSANGCTRDTRLRVQWLSEDESRTAVMEVDVI